MGFSISNRPCIERRARAVCIIILTISDDLVQALNLFVAAKAKDIDWDTAIMMSSYDLEQQHAETMSKGWKPKSRRQATVKTVASKTLTAKQQI